MTASRFSRFDGFLIVALLLLALGIKIVYLQTAESLYNSEEAPIVASDVVAQNPHQVDIGATRLYGTGPFTTAVSIYVLGFKPVALKLPNLVFFLGTLFFLALLARHVLPATPRYIFILPALLLAIGPPVAQIWGLKNRGGFIETMFALAFLLWMMARKNGYFRANSNQLLFFAIVIGIATFSQPIAIIYGLVLLFFVNLRVFRERPGDTAAALFWSGFGLFVGMLPLIVLNFYFDLNTLRVIVGGEVPAGIGDLGKLGRGLELLQGGIPRLLGLKEQWSNAWVVPAPLALTLYGVFALPFLAGVVQTLRDFLRTWKTDIWLVVLCVFFAIAAANIVFSWGNFQYEPRRLLLLYVPYVLLAARGLATSRYLAMAFLGMWLIFNAWTNFSYIKKHPNGFSHGVYQPLDGLAEFLLERGITGVYTDVWVGNRLTFASEGKIAWFRTKYMPTSYGFRSDGMVKPQYAVLFDSRRLGRDKAETFVRHLEQSGIACEHADVNGIDVYFRCSRPFGIDGLGN